MKKILDVFTKNQIKVAIKTLQMPDAILNYLACFSGPTKEDAREVLRENGWTDKEIEKLENK